MGRLKAWLLDCQEWSELDDDVKDDYPTDGSESNRIVKEDSPWLTRNLGYPSQEYLLQTIDEDLPF